MAFNEITIADTAGKGVVGLPDTPELSATQMQQKFDELALDVIIPKYNELVRQIKEYAAASSVGAAVPANVIAEQNIQSILDALAGGQSILNTEVGASKIGVQYPDGRTLQDVADSLVRFAQSLASDTGAAEIGVRYPWGSNLQDVVNGVVGLAEDLASTRGAASVGAQAPIGLAGNNIQEVLNSANVEIQNTKTAIGQLSTDIMQKSVYDTDNDGIVDHAEVADGIADLDNAGIQAKLVAGANINIDPTTNTISATGGGGGGATVDYGTTEEFEAVKDSLPEGASYCITDDYDEIIAYENIYSTDEVRIGTFLGKPLYRKMIPLNISIESITDITPYIQSYMDILVNALVVRYNPDDRARTCCDPVTIWYTSGWKLTGVDTAKRKDGDTQYLVVEYTKVGE